MEEKKKTTSKKNGSNNSKKTTTKKNNNTTTTSIISTSKVNSITTTTTIPTTSTTGVAKAPKKPSNLVALEGKNCVVLSWSTSEDASGYSVSRSFDREKWKKIARFDGNTNNFVDYEPLDDVACYYSIKAFNRTKYIVFFHICYTHVLYN